MEGSHVIDGNNSSFQPKCGICSSCISHWGCRGFSFAPLLMSSLSILHRHAPWHIYIYIYPSLSLYLSTFLSIYLSIDLSIYLFYLNMYIYICLFTDIFISMLHRHRYTDGLIVYIPKSAIPDWRVTIPKHPTISWSRWINSSVDKRVTSMPAIAALAFTPRDKSEALHSRLTMGTGGAAEDMLLGSWCSAWSRLAGHL